jgi:SNF2 family DNA or RNA helicase
MDNEVTAATYPYRVEPLSHQRSDMERMALESGFAFLHEMGTGKTKLCVDNGALLYLRREIDAFLVVAPSSVHSSWITEQLPTHMPESIWRAARTHSYKTESPLTKRQKRALEDLLAHDGLAVLTISYEQFITKLGKQTVWKFLQKRRVYYVLDESHHIKDPNGKTSKSIVKSGKYARYRRIASGTPVSTGPFDIYPQIAFLDEGFWARNGIGGFDAFKGEFAQFRKEYNGRTGRDYPVLVRYRNLDRLHKMIAPISSRVLKSEVLDLPPKTYTSLEFELTREQRRVYDELVEEFMAMVAGELVMVEHPLVRLLRLQQVASGYLPTGEEDKLHRFAQNPRLELVEEIANGATCQGIIWARFQEDVTSIMGLLGQRAVRFDGQLAKEEREVSRVRFKSGEAQWFVANPACGAEGLTLNEAGIVLYFNNSFSLLQRDQSEDRAHRIGQRKSVQYIDLIAKETVDEPILGALRKKMDIASQITGDQLREWIR